MQRIALFSDIHGNLAALDAVLADIDSRRVDGTYCLGDLVGYGPDPAGVIARVRERAIPTLQGNYDEGVGHRRGECGCYYATDAARIDGAASYEFTDNALDDADHAWLAALPGQLRLELEGARVLLTHGSPRKINEYLLPDRSDSLLVRLAEEAEADVVCVGHIHVPYHRRMIGTGGDAIHYVSSGSAGKPKDGDWRACWVELVIGEETEVSTVATDDAAVGAVGDIGSMVGIAIHRVDYDVEAVARAMRAAGLPDSLAEALTRG